MKIRSFSVVLGLLLILGITSSMTMAGSSNISASTVQAQRWCRGTLATSYWGDGGSDGRDVWAIYTIPAGRSWNVGWRWPVTRQPHVNYVGRVSPGNRDAYAILIGGSALDKFFLRTWTRLALARSAWITYQC